MSIVSITDLVNINSILKNKEIPFKLHLSDACGGQSMWIESLSINRKVIDAEEIKIIESFFKNISVEIKFDKNTIYIK